jgi:hypothetical protein
VAIWLGIGFAGGGSEGQDLVQMSDAEHLKHAAVDGGLN